VAHEVPDVSTLDDRFQDNVSSFCGTGVWLLYTDKDFIHAASKNVPWYFALADSCTDLWPGIDNSVRSLRYAGAFWSFNAEAINLYEHINFAGEEVICDGEYSDAWQQFPSTKSAIVTGNSSWTLYEEPEYKGAKMCISPSSHVGSGDLVLNYKVMPILTIAKVGSLKKGCDSTRDHSASLPSPVSAFQPSASSVHSSSPHSSRLGSPLPHQPVPHRGAHPPQE